MLKIFSNHNKILEDRLRDKEKQFTTIRTISDTLLLPPYNERYTATLKAILDNLESIYGIFGYFDEDGKFICYSLNEKGDVKNHISDSITTFPYTYSGKILKDTFKNKQTYLLNEPLIISDEDLSIITVISAPIIFREKIIGLLLIADRERNYSEKDREFIEKISDCISPILYTQLERDKYKTHQEQVQEELSQSRKKYYNIFKNAAVAIGEQDISHIKQLIDDLKSQGITHFKKYFENNPHVVQKAIGKIKVIDVNEEAVRMYEAENKEELIRSLKKFLVPQSLPIMKDILAAICEGKHTFEAEAAVRTLKGNTLDILLTLSIAPLTSELDRMLVTIMDISELKQAKKAVQKERDTAQKYLDIAGVIFVVIDNDERVSLINQKGCDVLGYKKEEIIGHNWFDKIIPHRLREKVRGVFKDICSGMIEDAEYYENSVLCKNGQERIVAWHNSIIKDEQGQIPSVFSSGEDITERLMLQEQLYQSQKMEAIGRLAGGVAHDFNNILTVITGYSEIILDNLNIDAPIYTKVEEIMKAGMKASSLTQQMLTFSRKQKTQLNVVNLNKIIVEMKEMLCHLIGEHIELTTELDPGDGHIRADSGQIEQVIMNLVINARDAMPDSGTIKITTKRIMCSGRESSEQSFIKPGPYVMLTISDTGCGMDRETKSRVFEPFFTTKSSGKGTGLGLSTVYSIIKQSSGYILVSSEPQQGTTFTIYLSSCEDAENLPELKTSTNKLLRGTETILVVEDEDAVRKLACIILEKRGYTVFEAENADEALKICKEHNGAFHLIITDIIMPGKDGKELARAILNLYPHIRILYISGYSNDMLSQYGIENEEKEIHFLKKPLTPSQLLCKVREVIEDTSS